MAAPAGAPASTPPKAPTRSWSARPTLPATSPRRPASASRSTEPAPRFRRWAPRRARPASTPATNDGGAATYTGGSGTAVLTFSYVVAAGQNTSDLAVTAANLNGATVRD